VRTWISVWRITSRRWLDLVKSGVVRAEHIPCPVMSMFTPVAPDAGRRWPIPVDTQDDTGVDQRAEDEIWEVTEGPAEEYDETEGEDGEGDAVAALLQLAQWELVE
jgi:hypothetical protein